MLGNVWQFRTLRDTHAWGTDTCYQLKTMWDQRHLFKHWEPVWSSVLAGRDGTVTPRGSGVVTSSQRFEWTRTFTLDFKFVWPRMTALFVPSEAHSSVNLSNHSNPFLKSSSLSFLFCWVRGKVSRRTQIRVYTVAFQLCDLRSFPSSDSNTYSSLI